VQEQGATVEREGRWASHVTSSAGTVARGLVVGPAAVAIIRCQRGESKGAGRVISTSPVTGLLLWLTLALWSRNRTRCQAITRGGWETPTFSPTCAEARERGPAQALLLMETWSIDDVFRDGHLRLASKDRHGKQLTSAEDEAEKGQQRREDREHGPRSHDDPISKDAHTGHSRESTRSANGEYVRHCRFAGMRGLLRR
jgi:hypothetical protein